MLKRESPGKPGFFVVKEIRNVKKQTTLIVLSTLIKRQTVNQVAIRRLFLNRGFSPERTNMIKEKFKKVTTLALAGVLAVGMMAGSVSQVSAATPEDEAKITVGKTLTINGTKFPDIETFEFELEAVQGYTNPNASTTVDGQTIPASQVPMPTGATNNKIKKTVGDFTTTQTGDSASAKTRKDAFGNIKYTTAGYYLYTRATCS